MTSVTDMDHENLVVVHYNQYAGGKFFINCLSHQQGVMPGVGVASAKGHTHHYWAVDYSWHPDDKHELKIARINNTLPPPDKMQEWAGREAGCVYFWGAMFWQLTGAISNQAYEMESPSTESLQVLEDNICFIINHDVTLPMYQLACQHWPRARHITLYNANNFQRLAVQLKNPLHPFPTKDLQFNELPRDLPNMFYLDVENTYHDVAKIKAATRDCLAWLGIEQIKLHSNFDSYAQKYVDLHYPTMIS